MLMNTSRVREDGSASSLLLVVMMLAFVVSTAFGVWAFIGRQEKDDQLEQKIAAATVVAVQEAETAKEAEFAEREKNPFRSYAGSPTYGSLKFDFPKNWNVYAVDKDSGTILDFYAQPGIIPGLGNEVNFAFRVQIIDKPYQEVVSKLESAVKKGSITTAPYRAPLVPSELGLLVRGEVVKGKQGIQVFLPQRDKTFVLWTESEEFIDDFQKVMETLTFVP